MVDQQLLTIREASDRLGLRESTLRRWVLQRRIAYCKIGRAVRVPAAVIEEMVRVGYRETTTR